MEDILSSIKVNYNRFTKVKKKIADYILEDPGRVVYMSITDLAEKTFVGESTIFRFCNDIGCGGYQEFRITLSNQLSVNSTISEKSPDSICSQLCSALKETKEMLKTKDIATASHYLCKASRIAFFGFGGSSVAARAGFNLFSKIKPNVISDTDSHSQTVIASLLSKTDTAVFISHSGSTKDTIEAAKQAKKSGAKTIVITRFKKSPLTEYSDLTLLCGSNDEVLTGNEISIEIVQLYLIEVLYREVCKLIPTVSKRNLSHVREVLYTKMV